MAEVGRGKARADQRGAALAAQKTRRSGKAARFKKNRRGHSFIDGIKSDKRMGFVLREAPYAASNKALIKTTGAVRRPCVKLQRSDRMTGVRAASCCPGPPPPAPPHDRPERRRGVRAHCAARANRRRAFNFVREGALMRRFDTAVRTTSIDPKRRILRAMTTANNRQRAAAFWAVCSIWDDSRVILNLWLTFGGKVNG